MRTLPAWFRPQVARTTAEAAPPPVLAAAADVPASQPATAPGSAASAAPEAAAVEPAPRPPSRLFEAEKPRMGEMAAALKAALDRVAAAKWQNQALAAVALLAVGGVGYAGGLKTGRAPDRAAETRWTEAESHLRQTREEAVRLTGEVKSLRLAVDGLKGDRDRSRGDLSGRQAQLSEKVERSTAEQNARMAKLAEQLDRIEKTQRDPSRVAAVTDRLDRIEKQVQAAPAAPTPPPKPVAAAMPAAPEVTTTGSLPDAKPAAKPAETDHRKVQVEGYVLRDIEGGLALIEARNGRYYEVGAGMTIPGLGRVEAIERRGRQWVVVTPKGFIGER